MVFLKKAGLLRDRLAVSDPFSLGVELNFGKHLRLNPMAYSEIRRHNSQLHNQNTKGFENLSSLYQVQ